MKYYDSEWTDAGGRIKTNMPSLAALGCPRCGATLSLGFEHTCGDMAAKPAAPPADKPKRGSKHGR